MCIEIKVDLDDKGKSKSQKSNKGKGNVYSNNVILIFICNVLL